MNAVTIYLKLYAECVRKSYAGLIKAPWTFLLPLALGVGLQYLGLLLAPLGIIGGFLFSFATSAVFSCYLYFVGEVVAQSRVSLSEFRTSIGKYFWSVLNVMFVFWIARLLLGPFLSRAEEGAIIWRLLELAALILLNPVPEVIYQKGTYGGLETVQQSFRFIQENWIEWFVPNLPLLAWFFLDLPDHFGSFDMGILWVLVTAALIHFVMVFRGHLFESLSGSSHRQRMFKYRNG
jgi:hypothetical protein